MTPEDEVWLGCSELEETVVAVVGFGVGCTDLEPEGGDTEASGGGDNVVDGVSETGTVTVTFLKIV